MKKLLLLTLVLTLSFGFVCTDASAFPKIFKNKRARYDLQVGARYHLLYIGPVAGRVEAINHGPGKADLEIYSAEYDEAGNVKKEYEKIKYPLCPGVPVCLHIPALPGGGSNRVKLVSQNRDTNATVIIKDARVAASEMVIREWFD